MVTISAGSPPERVLRVAVIGGGHGCYAAAADLSLRGHSVRLWRRGADELVDVQREGGLELVDAAGTHSAKLEFASPDIAEALDGADLVMCPLPATAQADVASLIAPHLRDGQVIFIPPGTLGSVEMARIVQTARGRVDVAFAEAGTLPWLARKHGPTTVAVTARATRLPTGVFPATSSARAFTILERAFPAVERLSDALDAALTNAGPVIHPPLIALNAAPIEHFDTWDIHNEGTQRSVRRVQDALDAERMAIRETFGYGAPHYPLADHYSAEGEEWMYGNAAHERLVDSKDWREPLELETHRYVREDVACGLNLLVDLGDAAGVPVPVARGLRDVIGAFTPDLLARGRSLATLGLGALGPADLRAILDRGLPS